MNKYIVCVLIGWTCSAQTPVMSPAQIQAALLRDLRGVAERTADLDNSQSSIEQLGSARTRSLDHPADEAISIKQLQHKVPKRARQAAARAKKWSQAGDHTRAAIELESATRWDPEFVGAYNALGIQYGRCGRLQEAADAFRHVIQLAPEDWVGHYNLGVAMFQSGDPVGALQSAWRALRLAPAQPTVNLFVGYLLSLRQETQTEGVSYLQYAALDGIEGIEPGSVHWFTA